MSVDDAIETAKKIARQFKTGAFDRQSLAAALGAKSANSGAFNLKVADLRKFGVLEGRGDDMRAPDLSQRIAVPGNQEAYASSVRELVCKVPLYKVLADTYPSGAPTEEEFFASLLNLTKADRLDVEKQAPRIRSQFSEALSRMGPTTVAPPPPPAGRDRVPPAEPEATTIELRAGGVAQLKFAFTPEGISQMAKLCDAGFWEYLKNLAAAMATGSKPEGS